MHLSYKARFGNPITVAVILQITFSIFLTGVTGKFVTGQHQFQDYFAGFYDIRAFGFDNHAILGGSHTAGYQIAPSLGLYHTHPAGTRQFQIRVKTKGRYISTRLTAGIYQHSTLRHHYFFTIYS
jgi:hypothetical protein